jgi:hypothetical protein
MTVMNLRIPSTGGFSRRAELREVVMHPTDGIQDPDSKSLYSKGRSM